VRPSVVTRHPSAPAMQSDAELFDGRISQSPLKKETRMRLFVFAALLSFSAWAAYAQSPPAEVVVGTVAAERKPIAQALDFVGRVDAIERVEVRARVTGYLEAVLFKEGDLVKEGAPLYRIEKGLFQAAVVQAQGELDKGKAAKALAVIQRQRMEDLAKQQAGTLVERDKAVAADKQADGVLLIDQANLDTAKINLGYTDIVSPVTGKVGKTNLTKGNVVGPDSGVLTTIVSQDPMYVTFPVSQREFLRVQQRGRQLNVQALKVQLRFPDGTTYDQSGDINFVNVTVDRATDTVLVRATFPNPTGVLIDGQLVRVNVESSTPEAKVVVPQSALIADQEGTYVFVVEDGKAVVKRVKIGGQRGTDAVIDQGLSGGEQVIVEGLQAVKPGIAVRANPVLTIVGRN
jgi:membrane fusion protein, multidrug efflux system